MPRANARQHAPIEPMRMGSEYSSARAYLARDPIPAPQASRRKLRVEPQPGSNDTDFGIPDQRED